MVSTYEYDCIGNLVGVSYSDGTPSVTFTYNRLGGVCAAFTSGVCSYKYTYDENNLIIISEDSIINGITNRVVKKVDAQGRLFSVDNQLFNIPSASLQSTKYNYSPEGRLLSLSVEFDGNDSFGFAYNYRGNTRTISGWESSLGYEISRVYEGSSDHISAVTNLWNNQCVFSVNYNNDALGRRVRQQDSIGGSNIYTYNSFSELSSSSNSMGTFSFCYDLSGNRRTSSTHDVDVSYDANNVNEYCSMSIGSVTNYMTYDLDGNQLTNGKGWYFKWNGENRLFCASNEEFIVSYAYDHEGRLVNKNVEKVESTSNDFEQYSKCQFWNDYNIVSEVTIGDGYTNLVQNIWGPDLSGFIDGVGGVGGLLMVVTGDEIYTPCYDAGGNIRSYLNRAGETVAAKSYSPFGMIVNSTGPKIDLFTHWWNTKPYCSLMNLVEYEFRLYSPEMGRWISRDPVDETSEFFFVDNDPINNCDILGLANSSSGEQCLSIESQHNYDYRIKPLKSRVLSAIKNFSVEGHLNASYSLRGEMCSSCCISGPFKGEHRLSGSGTVTLSGNGSLDMKFGKELTSSLFWEKYKFYLFAGIGLNLSVEGKGEGSFRFDGCSRTGSLNAALTDTITAELRGGVEGWLKKRVSRGGRGGPKYATVAAVSALLKGSLDTGVTVELSCGMDTCTLSSYLLPVTGKAWVEGTWKRRTFKADLFDSQTIVGATEIESITFDSPLKGYGQ